MKQFYDVECTRCGICVRECEYRGAISLSETGARVDLDACIGCGHCMAVCPTGAMAHPKAPMGPQAGGLPSPVEFAQYLRQPRSVRWYKEQLLPRATMMQLLDIGRYAQTAANTQGISYLVLEGRDSVKGLGDLFCHTVLEQNIRDPLRPMLPAIAKEQLETGRDIIFRSAPQLIVALADEKHIRGRDNARFALTFIALLAPSLGAGTCWAGFFESLALDPVYAPFFCEYLRVPPGKKICGALMAGIPDMAYHRLPEREPLQVEWRAGAVHNQKGENTP